jgi:ORF6N domain
MILRHERVILESALAELYDVSVKRLNEQAKRNRKRFPADFMFQLTPRENKSFWIHAPVDTDGAVVI